MLLLPAVVVEVEVGGSLGVGCCVMGLTFGCWMLDVVVCAVK